MDTTLNKIIISTITDSGACQARRGKSVYSLRFLSQAVEMIILFKAVSIGKQPQICNGTGQILHLVVCTSQLHVSVASFSKICLLTTKAFMEFPTSEYYLLCPCTASFISLDLGFGCKY
jgi:hypothetical protein